MYYKGSGKIISFPQICIYLRMCLLRLRKWWGSTQDSGCFLLCIIHTLLPFSMEDLWETMRRSRSQPVGQCGEEAWGLKDAGPRKSPRKQLEKLSLVLTSWDCSFKIPPRGMVQGTLGSLEEFSSASSPHILVCPLVADPPDWRGAEQGQPGGRRRKEAGVGAGEGNFSQLPSLSTSSPFHLSNSIKYWFG